MKYLSFILLIGVFFGFKSAIKNEVVKNKFETKDLLDYKDLNKNLIVNTKEDLQGFWLYDFTDLDEGKYWGKFILLFEKIKDNRIEAKIIWKGKTSSVVFELKTDKDKFQLLFEKKLKAIPFRKLNLEINKGSGVLHGKMLFNDYENNVQTFEVEIPKKNFVYNIDNVVENHYVDSDKTGMGYRKYDIFGEIVTIEELKDAPENVKEAFKKAEKKDDSIQLIKKDISEGEMREGYFSTTDTIFKINPSKEILKNELVENLSKADLYVLRNSIFAKHGMIFKDAKLKEFFMEQSWYLPVSSNVTSSLTEVEKRNIDLFERYERNAKEYFRVFGR